MVGKSLITSFAQGVPGRAIMEVLGHAEIGVTMSVIQNPGSQGSPTHGRIFEKILRHAAVGN